MFCPKHGLLPHPVKSVLELRLFERGHVERIGHWIKITEHADEIGEKRRSVERFVARGTAQKVDPIGLACRKEGCGCENCTAKYSSSTP